MQGDNVAHAAGHPVEYALDRVDKEGRLVILHLLGDEVWTGLVHQTAQK